MPGIKYKQLSEMLSCKIYPPLKLKIYELKNALINIDKYLSLNTNKKTISNFY